METAVSDKLKFKVVSFNKLLGAIGFGSVRPKQLVHFTRQLATLVGAGLPLLKSLNTLEQQLEEGYLKTAIAKISQDVEAGDSFSVALSRFQRVFPVLFVNMIRAGEMGGMLDEILRRLADFLEKQQKLRERVRSALVYPVFVLTVALIILAILMIFVVPTFTNMFAELGGVLPLPTRILITISNFLRYRWYLLPLAIIVLFVSYKLLSLNPRHRLFVDKMKLKLPIFGELIQEICIARFSRTLGTLLSSGVSILSALDVVADTVGNVKISTSLMQVRRSIKEGESVAAPLEATGAFPPLVVKMVSVGEETGKLAEMLVKIADEYEDEVDVRVAGLTALLEPVLIVAMGLAVGFIVISMFLPLFALARLVGG
jgi:type IV pilus assembly protein PilC